MTAEPILAAAGVVAALGVLWRSTRGLRRLVRRVVLFLEDWNGEPARPGRAEVPSVPARLTALEQALQALPELAELVRQLRVAVSDNAQRVDVASERLTHLDSRVLDHRRRNEEQVRLLRVELEQRIGELGDLVVLGELVPRRQEGDRP